MICSCNRVVDSGVQIFVTVLILKVRVYKPLWLSLIWGLWYAVPRNCLHVGGSVLQILVAVINLKVQ